ncbi:MAG: hypothetical protein ACE1ZK_00750 [Nitrospirales bacterium]
MARFTLEEFSERRPKLVYIAGNVVDAKHVEAALSEIQIDYAMNVEPYANNSFLEGTYHGVFFYVSEGEAPRSRECLNGRGFTNTLALEDQ